LNAYGVVINGHQEQTNHQKYAQTLNAKAHTGINQEKRNLNYYL